MKIDNYLSVRRAFIFLDRPVTLSPPFYYISTKKRLYRLNKDKHLYTIYDREGQILTLKKTI